MSYVKLFESILDSTVWQAPDHARLVWITMLAMKNRDGVVEASIPGLAYRARVTIPQAEEALALFMAPDPYSRTPDHEGRRIEAVDGGWRLLNSDKYREKLDADDQRAKDADRKQRKRDRLAEQGLTSRGEPASGCVPPRPVASGCVPPNPGESEIQIQIRSRSDRERDPESDPKPSTLTGKSEKPKRAERKRSAETTIPEDWKPDATGLRIAAELRLDPAREATRFADWHASKGSTFADWQAAFRTWLRKSADFGQRGATTNNHAPRAPMRSATSGEPMRFDLSDFGDAKGGGS